MSFNDRFKTNYEGLKGIDWEAWGVGAGWVQNQLRRVESKQEKQQNITNLQHMFKTNYEGLKVEYGVVDGYVYREFKTNYEGLKAYKKLGVFHFEIKFKTNYEGLKDAIWGMPIYV